MLPVWLLGVCELIILGQHTNLGKLFRSFTLSILICILKAKWAYPKAIFIFYFTKNVFLNYTDLRARRASEVDEGRRVYRCTSQTCVGEGRKN